MSTRRVRLAAAVGAGVLLIAACGSDDDAGPSTTAGAAVPGTGASDAKPEGSDTATYAEGDIDEGLRPFIDQASADLAARLGVSVDDVEVWSAVLVVWPDASIGCPQPDMQYAQITTDGSIIELSVDGVIHRYHTGGSQGPFLCDQPLDRKPSAAG